MVNDALDEAILNEQPVTSVNQPPSATEPGKQPAASENQNISETPAVETPPAPETKQPETQTAPSTNWIQEASKSIGHEFQSEDELKALISKAKERDELENRYNALNLDLEKARAEAPKFANERIAKLNELYAGGASEQQINLFNKINSLGEIKALDPLEAKKLALQYQHDITAEQAEILLKDQYRLDEDVYDANIVAADKVKLKVEAAKDYEYLQGLKAKSEVTLAAAQQEDLQKQVREYAEKVTPIAKQIQESLTAIKGVNLNGKSGDEAFVTDLPVSEETRSQIADIVKEYAQNAAIPLNAEGIEHLKTYANNVAVINNWKNWVIDAASKAEQKVRAEYHNPSNISRGQDNPVNQSATTKQQTDQWVLDHA